MLSASSANAVKLPWKESGTLVLRRGPYLIAPDWMNLRPTQSRMSCMADI